MLLSEVARLISVLDVRSSQSTAGLIAIISRLLLRCEFRLGFVLRLTAPSFPAALPLASLLLWKGMVDQYWVLGAKVMPCLNAWRA